MIFSWSKKMTKTTRLNLWALFGSAVCDCCEAYVVLLDYRWIETVEVEKQDVFVVKTCQQCIRVTSSACNAGKKTFQLRHNHLTMSIYQNAWENLCSMSLQGFKITRFKYKFSRWLPKLCWLKTIFKYPPLPSSLLKKLLKIIATPTKTKEKRLEGLVVELVKSTTQVGVHSKRTGPQSKKHGTTW